jgi:hypothetical protein
MWAVREEKRGYGLILGMDRRGQYTVRSQLEHTISVPDRLLFSLTRS